MTARFLIGDVFDRMAEFPDGSFDFIVCSPPFLALRSYLPEGHPDKAKEIGSEPTPAVFLDTMLALAAEWRRLLAPHGSIAIELGDCYAGSGGAGGDYDENGLRAGQPRFRTDWSRSGVLPLSLCGIPQAFMLSLIYGYNVLDRRGPDSPAGRWRIRNEKPWIRTNPPVGALGNKERPATSYICVATLARDRYFDLDAVRTAHVDGRLSSGGGSAISAGVPRGARGDLQSNPVGAPPLDWFHPVDAILNTELDEHPGARGHHLRRALEQAGILTTLDALDISPRGYSGSHYAVWPKELVRLLIDEMCPRYVCLECGRALGSRDVSSTTVPGVRRTDHQQASEAERLSRDPVLFGTLRESEQRPESGIDSRVDQGREGLHPRASTRSSDGESRGLCDAAPASDGGAPGAESACRRGRASSERDQGRQPDRESRSADKGTTRSLPEAATDTATVPALRGHAPSESQCPDCGGATRRGRVLDPFVGSGTTLAVATGMARDAVGIDLDERNAELAIQRVGMFLEVDYGTRAEAAG